MIKGGPGPLENEINKILGSKREDRFSDHFSRKVDNQLQSRIRLHVPKDSFFNLQLCST